MNATAMPENLSRTYCVLFAIASGAAILAGASNIGIDGSFLLYCMMLMWSAIPFAISRKVFKSKERSWAVLIGYVVFCVMASILYPLGLLIPFVGWPVFHAVRGNKYPKQSNAAVEATAARPAHGARRLVISVSLSLMVLLGLMIVSVWWGLSNGREVRNEVAAFCVSVNIGDDTTGLDKKASVALKGNYAWSSMPNGEMELVMHKYSAFTKQGCTITAAGGKVTSSEKWGYAL